MENKKQNYKKYIGLGLIIGIGALLLADPVLATSAFNIDAGVKAATDPFIAGLKAHWGKGVLLTSGAAAIVGEGDGKQRAIRAAGAAGAAGAVVLGLIALFS